MNFIGISGVAVGWMLDVGCWMHLDTCAVEWVVDVHLAVFSSCAKYRCVSIRYVIRGFVRRKCLLIDYGFGFQSNANRFFCN